MLVFVASLTFALVCLGAAAFTADAIRWVLVAFEAVGVAFGVGFVAIAAIFRPDLLRSERFSIAQVYLEFLTAQDIDDSTRDSAETVILRLSGPTSPRRISRPKGTGIREQDDES